ncbi:MAG TPA: YncE family protein [Nitrospiria bacterium]|nr:YncE family protein [Nitrospiria bacterium]
MACFWTIGLSAGAALAVLSSAASPDPSGAESASSPRPQSMILFEVPHTDSIAVFDFETRRVIRRIDLGSGPPPGEGTREAPAGPSGYGGRYVYWIRHDGNDLAVIDTTDYRVVGRIPLREKGPGNVTVASDGQTLYIPHYQAKALTIFDLREKKQRVIPLPGYPGDIAIAPRGALLVTSRDSNQLLAVDEATGEVRAVDVGRNPVGVAVTPDGSQAYVSHDTEAAVEVIDLTAVPFHVVRRIQVKGAGGSAVAAGPDGKYVYVAHCCANSSLTVISVEKMAVKCELSLAPEGLDPVRIVFSPGGDEAFVLNSGSMNISSFRPPCGKPVTENPFGR